MVVLVFYPRLVFPHYTARNVNFTWRLIKDLSVCLSM